MKESKKIIIESIKKKNHNMVKTDKFDEVITLPQKFIEKVGGIGYKILHVGQFNKKVLCLSNNTDNYVELASSFLLKLGLSIGDCTNIIFDKNEIRLGPVIAAFVSNGTINRGKRQEPNFRTIELNKANKEANTILYFFSIKDVDFLNKSITGLYYNEKANLWEQKSFPLPDVLYDRGGGTLKKQIMFSQYIREYLDRFENIKKFNPRFLLEKWEMYEELSRYDDTTQHLPPTIKYNDVNQLQTFLSINKKVFIKDSKGNNGKNIMMVEQIKHNKYQYVYMKDKVISGIEKNVKLLDKLIKKTFRKNNLIIQKAIDVIKIGDKNVDMRVLVQRDGNNNIIITDYLVRLGIEQSPVTSTRTGSSVYKLESFF